MGVSVLISAGWYKIAGSDANAPLLSSTLRIFGLGVQAPVQKIDASAMMRTACLTPLKHLSLTSL